MAAGRGDNLKGEVFVRRVRGDDLETWPLFARAAKDNIASIRVLEKGGFKLSGHDMGFANARGEEIEESIYMLR